MSKPRIRPRNPLARVAFSAVLLLPFLVASSIALSAAPALAQKAERETLALVTSGVEIEVTAIDHQAENAAPQPSRIRVAPNRLRIDPAEGSQGGQEMTTIFRRERNDFLVVDHADEAFVLMDQTGIDQLVAQVKATMKQIDEQMASLPDEQRQLMLRAMMEEEQRAADTRLVRTDQEAEKGGFPCTLFEVRVRDELVRQVWVASWDDMPEPEIMRGALEGMEEFFDRLTGALGEVTSAVGGFQAFDLSGGSPFEELKEMGGFPIHSLDYVDGELVSETLVKSVKSAEIPGTIFAAPINYRQRTLFE